MPRSFFRYAIIASNSSNELLNAPDSLAFDTITNPVTGRIWMDRNIGASRLPEFMYDEDALGSLFQWGRFSDGHEKRSSASVSQTAVTAYPANGNQWDGKFILESDELPTGDWLSPQNDDLWLTETNIQSVCPEGFRIPTAEEWEQELNSWKSKNAKGAFESSLKLTLGGERYPGDGSVNGAGFKGGYWSSSVDSVFAKALVIYSSNAYIQDEKRAYGYSVRCIKVN